jgi:hypothetical protein
MVEKAVPQALFESAFFFEKILSPVDPRMAHSTYKRSYKKTWDEEKTCGS